VWEQLPIHGPRIEGEPSVIDQSLAIDVLRQCKLFAHVDDDGLRALAGLMRRRRFRRNEVIFHQGDPGDSLHVVANGAVKIVLPSAEGDEAIIATLRTGDFFGELSLLDGAPRSATATALEPSETLVLPRPVFYELLDQDMGLRDALLTGVARELRRLTGHVEELHFLDLAGRLAARLTRLAREAVPDAVDEVRLDWPFTQSDLASMIGGTRQSVNKLLSDLVDDGLVRIERDTLVICPIHASAKSPTTLVLSHCGPRCHDDEGGAHGRLPAATADGRLLTTGLTRWRGNRRRFSGGSHHG
jgi:CRP/FNR family transcriptional regulator, cyclic AMP receptor protein